MSIRSSIAPARHSTAPGPDPAVPRPARQRDLRRRRHRSASRKTLDRMRVRPATEPDPEIRRRVIPDWENHVLAFVLDEDFDEEGVDLALDRARRLACEVRCEDEDALWG